VTAEEVPPSVVIDGRCSEQEKGLMYERPHIQLQMFLFLPLISKPGGKGASNWNGFSSCSEGQVDE